ncbi:MAG TPA: nuclear transport factor 2 family protein [Gemmataceae bacterium]|nr:nuclear transport factor 2 family protein [Gemmataceae bacterium]
MAQGTALSEAEVRQLVVDWYRKLDVHAPVDEYRQLLADDGLEMRFPEATLHGFSAFRDWYERVVRIFFDEVHELKELRITPAGDQADVQLVVRWEARRWKPPAAKSEQLRFDAAQSWRVRRSAQSGRPVVVIYIVDSLTPLEGSVPL